MKIFNKEIKIQKHISQGCIDTLIVMLMTVSPTIIGVLYLLIKSKFNDFNPQYKSGEFLLYSVSFLCSAYLVFSEKTNGKKDWKSNINSLIFIILIIISGFYGIMVSVDEPNIKVIKYVSTIGFCFSIPLFLYSQIVNNKSTPDLIEQRTKEAKKIQDAIS